MCKSRPTKDVMTMIDPVNHEPKAMATVVRVSNVR